MYLYNIFTYTCICICACLYIYVYIISSYLLGVPFQILLIPCSNTDDQLCPDAK